ncbi:MAG: DUF4159 domain-containing protein, partial [Planctomycetaceae bacterium]|nr:DUF4159 domain-containing protein [Planctomycetaceae bacterium]
MFRLLRTICRTLLSLALLAALCGRTAAQEDDADLRANVLDSIRKAQEFLISRQLANGSWDSQHNSQYPLGATALAVQALLNSGLPAEHRAVARGLEFIRRAPDPDTTYELATCIMALAAGGQPGDIGRIGRMAGIIEGYQVKQRNNGYAFGAWDYGDGRSSTDNSNSQFAILGLREAAYAGIPIDEAVWRGAQEHWLSNAGGGAPGMPQPGESMAWSYQHGRGAGGSGSMTSAGIASLTITSGFVRSLDGETADGDIDCCGVDPEDQIVRAVIDSGNRWMANHFSVRSNPGADRWFLYYLYGLERAGRLTGTRFYGDHDWYREGARSLLESQAIQSGAFVSLMEKDPVSDTSLALLFLSKGLSPVLINKLKFGPRNGPGGEPDDSWWNIHPRDVSNLCDYLSGHNKWPRLVTWQVVDLQLASKNEGVSALLQAPVQYLSGRQSLDAIGEQELLLLRDYLGQGGFVFAVQGCDSEDFDTGIRDLVTRLYPDGE